MIIPNFGPRDQCSACDGGVGKNTGTNQKSHPKETDDTESNSASESDATEGYLNMLDSGMTHEDVVLYVAHKIRTKLKEHQGYSEDRAGNYRSFFN